MALIKCPECGKKISAQAKSCPSCGYDLPPPIEQKVIKGINTIGKLGINVTMGPLAVIMKIFYFLLGLFLIVIGAAFCITLIGIVIGIPLIALGNKMISGRK